MRTWKSYSLFLPCSLLFCLSSFSLQAQDAHRYDPPWNPPIGDTTVLDFTIKGINNVPDLHGDIVDPQLVIFFAGNQFMCVRELLEGFKKEHPEIQRIFAETLPPGILARQMQEGSLRIGNMLITHKPDVYTAGKAKIESMQDRFERVETYAYNDLTLMVKKGNPKNIQGLKDLQGDSVRVSMPNPAWEGIAKHIQTAYKKAGGQALDLAIMDTKVKDQTTYLTRIHHRESPLRILLSQSDVAPVWSSELVYQKSIGHPVDQVRIADNENVRVSYSAAKLKDAPRSKAADLFMDYLLSKPAKAIYEKYGFQVSP